MAETAPFPVLGFLYKAALDRVAVNVAKFLDKFRLAKDVEIVVTDLPELAARAFE